MVILVCVMAVSLIHNAPPDRWVTCSDLVEESRAQGVPPHLTVAVAMVESRLNAEAVSSAGALGPIQILPKWHCPGRKSEGCDLIHQGVALLRKLRVKYGSWDLAWCHYSAGTRCTEHGQRYARKVRGWLLALWATPCVMMDEGLRPPGKL